MGGFERPGSSFSVFKTGNTPLVVRGPIGEVFGKHEEKQQKRSFRDTSNLYAAHLDTESSRPQTVSGNPQDIRGGLRFGTYSQASFFSRHNPHPMRVRHINGLNGIPICSVSDHASFPLPQLQLHSPRCNRYVPPIRSGSSLLQLPHCFQQYPFKEKALPNIGIVPVTDSWREELQELCIKAGLSPNEEVQNLKRITGKPLSSQRKTIYSEETGRIKPPTRRYSSRGNRYNMDSVMPYMHIMQYPDMETVVLEMLCQILQTDSIQTIQQWLVSASEREKTLVSEIIETTLSPPRNLTHTRNKPHGAILPQTAYICGHFPDLCCWKTVKLWIFDKRCASSYRKHKNVEPCGVVQNAEQIEVL